jgi:alpha-amylase/alpha-mannosidase (GH57 family)
MRTAFVLHGHFYQPPREDPWTGVVPVQGSAAPFRDWNARITAECYRPNGEVPLVGEGGTILDLVDNYRLLSYNVGPTLLSWLETEAPDVYHRLVEADRATGHAMAQAYGHAILPLCNDRDLRTQVRWGLADFRRRFGRDADGMWLPETAVDPRVLGVLAEEGVRFTILAPHQVRPADDPDRVHGLRSTYRWRHPQRAELGVDLVVYDGGMSHDVAFGGIGSRELVDRAILGAAEQAPSPGEIGDDRLVVVATDGETFGHHRRFAELGIAHALAVEAPRRSVMLPCLADWLKDHPPSVVADVEASAWSCAHGVGRWMEDCGCHTGGDPDWNQQWRWPLRAAFDVLRDHAAEVFEERGAALFQDPWAARDAYIDVLIEARTLDDLLAEQGADDADGAVGHGPAERNEARLLLEIQRFSLLMYTSCGWFFNDLSGIETVQVLRYAGRCVELLAELGEPVPEDKFFDLLGQAHSNIPEEGSGRDLWERHVAPHFGTLGPAR